MEGRIETTDVLDARQFHLAVRRLADSLSYGTDRSPFLGAGLEYVQSRPYQYGDPVKAIDWRVTARTRIPYVKEYEAAKQLPVYLLMDTSASMTISSFRRSKYETAVLLAGGLALACLDRISPVGLLGVGRSRVHERPTLSKEQVMRWLHKLRTFRYDEPTALGQRVAELVPELAQHSLLVVLSDLHDPHALPMLKRANQQHDCAVLQLRDPAERAPLRAGFVRAREAETGRPLIALGQPAGLDQAAVEAELKRSGIDHLLVDIDQPYVSRLRRFFKARDLLGRGTR